MPFADVNAMCKYVGDKVGNRPKADRLNISEVVEFDNVVLAGKDGAFMNITYCKLMNLEFMPKISDTQRQIIRHFWCLVNVRQQGAVVRS